MRKLFSGVAGPMCAQQRAPWFSEARAFRGDGVPGRWRQTSRRVQSRPSSTAWTRTERRRSVVSPGRWMTKECRRRAVRGRGRPPQWRACANGSNTSTHSTQA